MVFFLKKFKYCSSDTHKFFLICIRTSSYYVVCSSNLLAYYYLVSYELIKRILISFWGISVDWRATLPLNFIKLLQPKLGRKIYQDPADNQFQSIKQVQNPQINARKSWHLFFVFLFLYYFLYLKQRQETNFCAINLGRM